jgi:hypothetical protein
VHVTADPVEGHSFKEGINTKLIQSPLEVRWKGKDYCFTGFVGFSQIIGLTQEKERQEEDRSWEQDVLTFKSKGRFINAEYGKHRIPPSRCFRNKT